MASNDTIRIVYNDLNSLGQVLGTAIYDVQAGGQMDWINGTPIPKADENTTKSRRAFSETLYDNQGRPYRQIVHGIEPNQVKNDGRKMASNQLEHLLFPMLRPGLWHPTRWLFMKRVANLGNDLRDAKSLSRTMTGTYLLQNRESL